MIVLAQDEARMLNHNYVGVEHLLLGLVREQEGLAARVLGSFDVTVRRARERVVQVVGAGEGVVAGDPPFAPRANKVFELALREARHLGQDHVDTEHILLAVLRENEGAATRILLGFDLHYEKVRQEVVAAGAPLRNPTTERPMPEDDSATAAAIRELAKQVDQLGNAVQGLPAAKVIAKAIAQGTLGGP